MLKIPKRSRESVRSSSSESSGKLRILGVSGGGSDRHGERRKRRGSWGMRAVPGRRRDAPQYRTWADVPHASGRDSPGTREAGSSAGSVLDGGGVDGLERRKRTGWCRLHQSGVRSVRRPRSGVGIGRGTGHRGSRNGDRSGGRQRIGSRCVLRGLRATAAGQSHRDPDRSPEPRPYLVHRSIRGRSRDLSVVTGRRVPA
jgi:hypothetical protein